MCSSPSTLVWRHDDSRNTCSYSLLVFMLKWPQYICIVLTSWPLWNSSTVRRTGKCHQSLLWRSGFYFRWSEAQPNLSTNVHFDRKMSNNVWALSPRVVIFNFQWLYELVWSVWVALLASLSSEAISPTVCCDYVFIAAAYCPTSGVWIWDDGGSAALAFSLLSQAGLFVFEQDKLSLSLEKRL